MQSVLIKDTTREERIRIVNQSLSGCGVCDNCNICGGGNVDEFYRPYIDGEKELREINMEYRFSMVH